GPSTYVTLKNFEFYAENTSSQARHGRMKTATSYSGLTGAGAVDVVETVEYDAYGRMAKRTTDLQRGGTSAGAFDYSTTYDDFSLPHVLTMPTCNVTGCGSAFGTITFGRD